ncbi:PKD domain-containing protein [Plebeiibacterium marinum]|uniref:PKD domain-containing protein n=1 Tax=Plebeiibacterium marinum TaxID=2992111 RepID=A0AAE3MDT1_9BACT|nr:PKD domain-containing protein [Plebeiobacterium marinum]MCW3805172.1 PKD domain-containing protein [Plebeiobacterium marinum]
MKQISNFIIAFVSLFVMQNGTAQQVEVKPLPTNSELKNDFAPFVIDSCLYFASNRKHELIKTYLDQNNEGLYRIYESDVLLNDDFGKEEVVNSEKLCKLNTSSICFSEDKSRIFITQNQYTTIQRSKGRENLLGIFVIENNDGKWGRPSSFPYNSRRSFSNGQVTASPDGNTIFYVSNQDGGYGKTDIYQSTFKDGEWTEPVNLGEKVNTSGNELFPFYHHSGKLYFSSDEHNSIGGLDIFYTSWNGNEWSEPVQLDEPINSTKNDFSCYIYPGETEGFFASDRNGTDDIFQFSNPYPTFPNAKTQVDDNYCFTLFENGPFKSDTLPYKYKWYFGDGESADGLEVRHCFPGAGMYNVHLSVVDTLAKVDLFTVAQYELELKQTQQVYISCPDTVQINTPVTFSAANSVLKDFKPAQYYWSLGENNRAKGVTINYVFRKKGIYNIECGVISVDDHTEKMASTRQIVVKE